MKFNRNILLLVTLSLLALNAASKLRTTATVTALPPTKANNSDNPGMMPSGTPNVKPPTPIISIPEPKPETPTTGSGFGNFSRSCKSYTYNAATYKLTASCMKYDKSYKSTTIDINNCYVVSSKDKLGHRSWYNSEMKKYCKNCKVNTNKLELGCDCHYSSNTYYPSTMNLNVYIKNSNGELSC